MSRLENLSNHRRSNDPLTSWQRWWFYGMFLTLTGFVVIGVVMQIIELKYGVHIFGRAVFATAVVIMVVACGFLLFVMRETERALYGAFELAFGVLVISLTFVIGAKPTTGNFWSREALYTFSQVGGCVYLIVRGIDNLNQGLKRYPKLYRRWQWICMMKIEDQPKKQRYPWQKD
ncbi:hypothetical protein [Rhizobium leguminosarum]|uniref:hypothetical protein n=1 Tax=Rhizobium leguminosarum TaxID=384 RepID=UPI003F970C08